MKETKVAKRYFAPSLNVAASILSKGVFHRRLSTQCGLNKITFLCDKQLLLNYKFTVLAWRSPYFLWLLHSIKLNCFGNWSRLATCQSFLHCGRHFSAFILLDGFNSQLFIIITKANKPTQTQKSGSVTIKRVGWAWASEIIGAGSLTGTHRSIRTDQDQEKTRDHKPRIQSSLRRRGVCLEFFIPFQLSKQLTKSSSLPPIDPKVCCTRSWVSGNSNGWKGCQEYSQSFDEVIKKSGKSLSGVFKSFWCANGEFGNCFLVVIEKDK